LCRLWAGLECGVGGGALILAWFALHALAHKEQWWSKFNVAGGIFYGPPVYHSGLGRATLAGAAVLLLFYGLAGALFGWLANPASGRRTLGLALLYVGLLHVLESFRLWPSMGLFASLWFPWSATLPADLLLLLALARFPHCYRGLAEDPGSGAQPLPGPLGPAPEPLEPPPETRAAAPAPAPPSEDGPRP
jgi:hypothetical protein